MCENCDTTEHCGIDCEDCNDIACTHCDLGHEICKTDGNRCVECNTNNNCKDGYDCSNNICVKSCDGVSVGGYCWYLGAAGQSCNTVCSGHGGYNAATRDYAGSGGTTTRCTNVISALGLSGTLRISDVVTNCGCFWGQYTAPGPWEPCWDGSTTTASAWNNYIQRACACND
jgi:hypothetical protein